jgi:AraC-like DNA-binding protein
MAADEICWIDAMNHRLGHSIERMVGVLEASTLTLTAADSLDFRATHLSWKHVETGQPTECETADGYMVYLLRRPLLPHPCWVDQRSISREAIAPGQFLLLDLCARREAVVRGDVDCISIYSSRDSLRTFQEEHDLPVTGTLAAVDETPYEDEIVWHLSEALVPVLRRPELATKLFVSHVAYALLSRLSAEYGISGALRHVRGGLAAWQERRAKDLLLANLDGEISLEELAAECRLSRSHFARAFKRSVGTSPHRWLIKERLEKAKLLLLRTELTVEEVAASCGFYDTSHLTRVFARATRFTPGLWRRLHS